MRPAYSSSVSATSLTRLLREEIADRAPDVLLRRQVAHAHGVAAALQLAEDLGELGLARPEGGDAAGLAVAGVVQQRRQLAEHAPRRVAVLGRVLAVRGVEEVDVVAARIEALLHQVEREPRHARGHRAAARRSLEELA